MHGGGHERGMRSGTLPTHQIVGMGEAFRIAQGRDGDRERAHPHAARPAVAGLTDMEEVYVNGDLEQRVPHNLNVSFNFVEGESLIMAIKDIAVSSGSACTSASLEPSYVLRALGPQRRARAQLDPLHPRALHHRGRHRLHGRSSSGAQVGKLREMSPLWEMHQGRHRLSNTVAVGRALRRNRHGIQRKSHSTTTKIRATSARFAKDDDDVGTGMVGAPACGDVMKLQIKVGPGRPHRGREVQDLRLRLGHRVVVARHRMGEGQDARPGR